MKLRLCVAIASLCWMPQSAWAELICEGGDGDCASGTATQCIDTENDSVSPGCASFGYPLKVEDFLFCVDPGCSMVPVAVPELEEYAAVLFLGLALLVGWNARRRGIPSTA